MSPHTDLLSVIDKRVIIQHAFAAVTGGLFEDIIAVFPVVVLESHALRNFASSKRLNRDLEETVTHMDQLHMNLPALLAAQDVELAELREGVLKGAIEKAALKSRGQDIQTYRKALLGSLDASAARANLAAQKLTAIHSTGRSDLGEQTQTANGLARDLKAARTMIEMQL